MKRLKRVYKKDISSLLSDSSFWDYEFLSISKHRLISHWNNPNLDDDDIVLILAYIDDELVGYMGLFIDYIFLRGENKKIGWLSTWWVHPKTKGTGIGRDILNDMYEANNGYIGISQFTPSAKRVYDKSGYFVELKQGIGYRYILNSDVKLMLTNKFQFLKKVGFITSFIDVIYNLKGKIKFKNFGNDLINRKISIEYLREVDNESMEFINETNTNHISKKSEQFYNWMLSYYWVLKAPLLELTQKSKYAFSIYDKNFDISFLKIKKENKIVGILVLQKRNLRVKVLFSYYLKDQASIVGDVLIRDSLAQNVNDVLCYDILLNDYLVAKNCFLYKAKLEKYSIISKSFGVEDFSDIYMNFGDGDCSFA
jgi:GNAT superfamily N-acetyltransferase